MSKEYIIGEEVEKKEFRSMHLLSWATIVVSFIALLISFAAYRQSKKMEVINYSDVLMKDVKIVGQNSDQDIIQNIFTNTGSITAKNVKYKIYLVMFDDLPSVIEILGFKRASIVFDSQLVNDISPKTDENIPYTIIEHNLFSNLNKTKVKDFSGKMNAIVYHISYTDDFQQKIIDKYFFYYYRIGENTIFTLSKVEYVKVKKYLLEYLQSQSTHLSIEDQKMITFLSNE